MSLVEHARRELEFARLLDKDSDYEGQIGIDTLALITVFAEQGHSGASAGLVRELFCKLADYQPIRGLQGTDDEWVEVADGVKQNKRCARVFWQSDRGYYDLDGIVFEDPDGMRSTNRESMTKVVFPYHPKSVVVKRDAKGKYTLPPGVEQVYPPSE